MTESEYAIKLSNDIAHRLSLYCGDEQEWMMSHYKDIKGLLGKYHKLILASRFEIEDLEKECYEKIHENMGYALRYLDGSRYFRTTRLKREVHNLMMIYGLSDLIHRGITLVKFYAPKGELLSDILLHSYCCNYSRCTDDVCAALGVGRSSLYRGKKEALGYLGFYFYEIVIPEAKGCLGTPL